MPNEDPLTVVIFGASGDLTARKLIPGLYHLSANEEFVFHQIGLPLAGTEPFR